MEKSKESEKKEKNTTHIKNYEDGPSKFVRNELGLLNNVDYEFAEDGSVNWSP